MSNNILREEIQDAIENNSDINLRDNITDLKEKIFKALEIENCDRVSRERVMNIIFQLQQENGVLQVQWNKLNTLSELRFSKSENVEDEFKNNEYDRMPLTPPLWFKEIVNMFLNEMGALIKDYTAERFKTECSFKNCDNENIRKHDNDIYKCPCIQRICVFLKIYKMFYKNINKEKILPNVCIYLLTLF